MLTFGVADARAATVRPAQEITKCPDGRPSARYRSGTDAHRRQEPHEP